MITKDQAVAARHGQTFHYTGQQECKRTVGQRGGISYYVTQVRVSGACQTWKRHPDHFRLPVKFGLYESFAIEHHNAGDWHRAEDCPLRYVDLRDVVAEG